VSSADSQAVTYANKTYSVVHTIADVGISVDMGTRSEQFPVNSLFQRHENSRFGIKYMKKAIFMLYIYNFM